MNRPGPDTLVAYDANRKALFFAGPSGPVGPFMTKHLRAMGYTIDDEVCARSLPRLDNGAILPVSAADAQRIREALKSR